MSYFLHNMANKTRDRHLNDPRGQDDQTLSPEDARIAFMGGVNYPEAAYAQAVVKRKIGRDQIRRIVGLGEDGEPIYATETVRPTLEREERIY